MSTKSHGKETIQLRIKSVGKDLAQDLLDVVFKHYPDLSRSRDTLSILKYFGTYFDKYFNATPVRTLIEESPYMSLSFLKDYVQYYATSFKDYKKKCLRIHFFSEEIIDENRLSELIAEPDSSLNDSYLGHIVIKPIPNSLLGPTLIRPPDHGLHPEITCNCVRRYDLNLFGQRLHLDSLIFQQQDTVVGACASVALWSALHKTCHIFSHMSPTVGEITELAGLGFEVGRVLPNRGLDLNQIIKVINAVGMVSEVKNERPRIIRDDRLPKPIRVFDYTFLKRFVYAYSRAGLPVLLGFDIYTNGRVRGRHMVTINGYQLKKKPTVSGHQGQYDFGLVADEITVLHAHDDQIGPFASMEVLTNWLSWGEGTRNAQVSAVVVPLDPLIRVTFDQVFPFIEVLSTYLALIGFRDNIGKSKSSKSPKKQKFIWDVYLQRGNHFKEQLLEVFHKDPSSIERDVLSEVFSLHLPRYIWVARLTYFDVAVLDILFDATDIPSDSCVIDILFYEKKGREYLKKHFSQKENQELFIELARRIYSENVHGLLKLLTEKLEAEILVEKSWRSP